jgi:dipeptidyl aminopeptidase/acylaminoacyl peptidase
MKMRVAVVAWVLLFARGTLAQESAIAPPEAIVEESVPAIPASLLESAGPYGSFRSAVLADWSPVRREMLIATRFGDTQQLHLLAMPQGARQQLTFFADAVTTGRFEPSKGQYLVFMKDIGGGEWYQLYRYDLASGVTTLLTDGKARNLMGPFSLSGKALAYMSTRRTGKNSDLWAMNPAEPKSDHLVAELAGGGWQAEDWSPDETKILVLEEVSINESYLWLVDARTGEKTPVTPRNPADKVSYSRARFSRDGQGIYCASDKGSEFHRLAYIDLASKKESSLSSDIPWDIEDFELSKDGKRIAFTSNENGVSVLRLMDAASHRQFTLPPLPAGVISGLRWHANGSELGFVVNNARGPADCYSLHLNGGRVERWTSSESAVKAENKEAELVKWESFDGRTISGFLYRPPAKFTGKRPVLVVIHGGPEGQSQPIFLGRNNYLLNELGIALVYPNVRGSTGYGKSFSLLDNGVHRDDAYKDINALFDWIAGREDLDPGRIAVTGGSYGGHMTLAVSAFYSDRIRCSIDIVGMSNLVTFLEHTEAYRRDLRRVEYGDERDPQVREFLERIAPMNNIAKIKKPMLVVAGKNDPRVPVSESEQIVRALKGAGTPVWYVMAKDEGHGFRKKPNQDYQFYATVEFLKQFLLN